MINIQLHHADCFDIFPQIPDKSIDLVLCDLPYGTSACRWDQVLSFDRLWDAYKRIIKESGVIALFATEPFSSVMITSNLSQFRFRWIWEKEQAGNFVLAKRQPLNVVEYINIFSPARAANGAKKNLVYNPEMLTRSKPTRSGGNPSRSDLLNPNSMLALKRTYTSAYPKNILRHNKPHSSVRLHPTEKPVDLLRYLIRTHTPKIPNTVVLDNCMGSGSTGEASILEGRAFIGIEKDEGYFQIAKDRIETKRRKRGTQPRKSR